MYLRKIDTEEFKTIYNEYMVIDFPDDELKPIQRMIDTMNQGLCFVLGLMDGDSLKAYAVFIIPPDGKEVLLDYFAVLKEYRGKNVGHEFFKVLSAYMKENMPGVRRMYIESEKTDSACPDNKTRIRRIDFYKNCGCTLSDVEACVFGVTFSILYYSFDNSIIKDDENDTDIVYSQLDYTYQCMFIKEHYDTQVRIWRI